MVTFKYINQHIYYLQKVLLQLFTRNSIISSDYIEEEKQILESNIKYIFYNSLFKNKFHYF